jgi:hypothetical protein
MQAAGDAGAEMREAHPGGATSLDGATSQTPATADTTSPL